MAVIHGWVGVAILSVGLGIGVLAWWAARPQRATASTVPAANLERVRALPLFRALARQEWNLRRIETACLALALSGAALMGARFVGVSDTAEEMRTRDVVLCLDVSGSMTEVDVDILDTYLALAETLTEERIGFVMFDAYAVTAFPLTTDRAYVMDQLGKAKKTIAEGPVPGASAPRVGSSLIGDGLATCLQHFDHQSDERSRTVVLGTDNLVSGDSLHTVAEAAAIAQQDGVMVFGVMPTGTEAEPVEDLRAAVRPTNGEVLVVEPGKPTNTAVISSAIEAQQKKAILTTAQDRSFDLVWPGALLFLAGLAGSLATAWRRP